MGFSYDYGANKFKKEKKKMYQSKKIKTFDLMNGGYRRELVDEIGDLSSYFNEETEEKEQIMIDNVYLPETKKLIEKIKNTKVDAFLKSEEREELLAFIEKNEGEEYYLYFDTIEIVIYGEYEEIEKEVWVPEKRIGLGEDGRLMSMAFSWLEEYGFEIPPMTLDSYRMKHYEVGSDTRTEEIINSDIREYGKKLEEFLKVVEKKPEDKYFDERMERWALIKSHLDNNVKFYYSY